MVVAGVRDEKIAQVVLHGFFGGGALIRRSRRWFTRRTAGTRSSWHTVVVYHTEGKKKSRLLVKGDSLFQMLGIVTEKIIYLVSFTLLQRNCPPFCFDGDEERTVMVDIAAHFGYRLGGIVTVDLRKVL